MKIILPGEFTDLNTYINAERTNRFKAAKIKKQETQAVAWALKINRVKKVVTPCYIGWYWWTKDARKDCDNVFFSKKWVLDGMKMAGIIPDDSFKYIVGSAYEYRGISKDNPRLELEIIPLQDKTK